MNFKKIVSNIDPTVLRFSGLEFFFWATCATYYPFLVVFLIHKQYTNTTIGTIMAINSFLVVFSQPFWGMVSDWVQSVKKVFMLCLTIAACILLSLPLFESVLIVAFTLAIITFFESALSPLLDSWVIQGIRSNSNISYGNIRLWGSLGYATLAYILGALIDYSSIYIIFPAYAILGVCTIVFAFKIKSDKPPTPITLSDLRPGKLFKNYHYIVFVLFATLLFTPHRSALIFLPQLIENVGGTKEQLGLCYSVLALSEVPVFLFSKYLTRKLKPIHLILLSTIFFLLKQVVLIFAVTPVQVILVQALQGPSFGLFLTGAVYYIDSLAPHELKSTAQTVATAIYFGGSGIIGSFGGGWFIDHLTLTKMYELGGILTVSIAILFIVSFPLGKLLIKN